MVWEYKTLGELAEVSSGGTPKKANSEFWNGDIPWYSSGELNEHFTLSSKEHITEAGLDGSNTKLFPEGSLLIGMYDTAALKMSILDRAGAFNQAIAGVKPNSELDLSFVLYAITNIKPELMKLRRGVRQKNLNQGKIKEIPIPDIDIAEQKRIVAILDKAFADIEQARAKTEQNFKNARELFESYLQQVFSQRGEGWEQSQLGELCSFQNGFAFKSKDSLGSSDTQLIRMGNLYQNVLDLERKPSFYPDSFADEYLRYRLEEGDLIISLTGTVGKEDYGFTVEIPKTEKALLLNQRIAKFIDLDSSKIEKRYLLRVLRSRSFLDDLYATAKGTRQANLSTAMMQKITITLPSIQQQQKIILELDRLEVELDSLIANYRSKLNNLDELKKSILQKAFSGELTKDKKEVVT